MSIVILIVSITGFVLLALTLPRHRERLLRRPLAISTASLKWLGCGILALALIVASQGWAHDVAITVWLGWLTVAGWLVVLLLSYWPDSGSRKAPRRRQLRRLTSRQSPPVSSSGRWWARGCGVLMLAISVGFLAAVQRAPDQPLSRADAYHGQIGPWSYVLAEVDPSRPAEEASAFELRFCDLCAPLVRQASLRLGAEPAGRGHRFEGRGATKTATVPSAEWIQLSANREAGVAIAGWLQVIDHQGRQYQQRIDIAALSPRVAERLESL